MSGQTSTHTTWASLKQSRGVENVSADKSAPSLSETTPSYLPDTMVLLPDEYHVFKADALERHLTLLRDGITLHLVAWSSTQKPTPSFVQDATDA